MVNGAELSADGTAAASGLKTRSQLMGEVNQKWRGELGKIGPELSAQTIRAVMSFLDEMRPSTAVVARTLLGLCAPGRGRRSTNIPLLEDAMVAMDDLLSCEAVRRQCIDASNTGFFIREQIGRVKGARFNWRRGIGLRAQDPTGPYGDDQFLDIIEVEWHSVLDAHTLWRVRGGQWAYWGMNALGRVSLCRLARASLVLGTKASIDLAMKLLIHVALSSEPQTVGSRSSFEIGSLLEQLGELLPRERRTPEWAKETEHRLGAVLRALLEAGALVEFALPVSRHAFGAGASIEAWLHEQLQLAVAMPGPDAAIGRYAANA